MKPVLDTDTHLSPQKQKHKLLSGGPVLGMLQVDPLKTFTRRLNRASDQGKLKIVLYYLYLYTDY